MSLSKLKEMSNKYGANSEFVLAGGGNTSYKTASDLYIKGSGTTLATITEQGFVRMNRKKLSAMWQANYAETMAEREREVLADLLDARGKEEGNKRPSVETLLHDLFPRKYVLHVHPPMINGVTCGVDGKKAVMEMFSGKAAWVPATKPGYILAADTKKVMDAYKAEKGVCPDVVFIESHGIFFAADTVDEMDKTVEKVMSTVKARVKRQPVFSEIEFDKEKAVKLAPAVRMLTFDGSSIVTFRTNSEVMRYAASKEAFKPISLAFTPDHIVYCKHEPLFVESRDDIAEQYDLLASEMASYIKRNNQKPKIIFVQGLGFFACGKNKKEADIAADVFMDEIKIAVYSESFGGYKFMTEEDISFIRNWEAESYRQSVSIGAGASKRLYEKIAIVTGAAQGFGKGIAEEMAAEGANLVIADLNEPGAVETADEISANSGKGRAVAVKADVGDETSVSDMVAKAVLTYGGLDIFVNNAGIVKAGSLEEMELRAFDLVTKINYTAYFLGVKYASRIMKIEHKFAPEYFTDIIQINSKSGLSGSNKNFAYAGSKFGGLGLTQSFALELAEYNIKVNSICPGNFLEGPLWTDPVKGLFVQYLHAGKVPGAKTVEDVKRSYESKVPLNRGCRVKDVSRAIIYVVEQQYETGQAIPVTGGQNMLN